jgi:hypothetical protein
MRTLFIYFSNGEVLKHKTKGTTPQLQRAFHLGRKVGQRTIEATTIQN